MPHPFDINDSTTIAAEVIPAVGRLGLTLEQNDEKVTFNIMNDFRGTLTLDVMPQFTKDNNVNDDHRNFGLVEVDERMSKWSPYPRNRSGLPHISYISRMPEAKGFYVWTQLTEGSYLKIVHRSSGLVEVGECMSKWSPYPRNSSGLPHVSFVSRMPMAKGIENFPADFQLNNKSIISKWRSELPQRMYICRIPMPKGIESFATDLPDLNSTSTESETGEVNDDLSDIPSLEE